MVEDLLILASRNTVSPEDEFEVSLTSKLARVHYSNFFASVDGFIESTFKELFFQQLCPQATRVRRTGPQ